MKQKKNTRNWQVKVKKTEKVKQKPRQQRLGFHGYYETQVGGAFGVANRRRGFRGWSGQVSRQAGKSSK